MKKILLVSAILLSSPLVLAEGASWEEVGESISNTSGKAWQATKESSSDAWDATKEGSSDAWESTKEYSSETWDKTKKAVEE